MTAVSIAFAEPSDSSSGIAFGSLIDLARLQTGTPEGEICEACSTINIGSARLCKGCSHKLPAFYAAGSSGESMPSAAQPRVGSQRASALDFAFFWFVIISLVVITRFIPIG
ncbi:hypothetical protein AB4Z46_10325 [Variovorax sp. M-6]